MGYDPSNVFARILRKEIPAKTILETDDLLAFEDINPRAPVHVLVIPKCEVATVNDFSESDALLIGKMVLAAKQIAEERGIAGTGYRLVINCNRNGGQEVPHVHLHLLGGRPMTWPPG